MAGSLLLSLSWKVISYGGVSTPQFVLEGHKLWWGLYSAVCVGRS